MRAASRLRENSRMAKSNPALAAEIVAAFVSNNPLPKGELPDLIHALHSAVERLAAGPERAPPQAVAKAPAVSVRKSITPDFLISLEASGLREVTRKRGLAPPRAHSALPITRRRRDQLSLVDQSKSRNTRAGWPAFASDWSRASSNASAMRPSSRALRARPKT